MIHPQLPAGFTLLDRGGLIAAIKAGYSDRLARAGLLHGADAVAALPGARPLGGRGQVFSIPLPPTDDRVVVRCSRRGGLAASLLRDRYWGSARVFRELAVTEAMRAAGLPVPQIVAAIARRAGGAFWRTAIITLEIPDAVELSAFFAARRGEPGASVVERRAVICAVASGVRRMHDAGFLHADLQMKNILVRPTGGTPEVFLLDLDGARHEPALSGAARERNLFRLNRSIAKLGVAAVSRADRLRFLKSYFGADRLDHRAEVALVERCLRHLARHQRLWRRP